MSIICILYFVVGIFLSFMWWNDEYKAEYEFTKAMYGHVEEPMVVLLLLFMMFLWPIKLFKNIIEPCNDD